MMQTRKLTEVKTKQITAHAVVEPCIMDHKVPFYPRRDFGCSAEGLQTPLP